jgi:hypothetical protein
LVRGKEIIDLVSEQGKRRYIDGKRRPRGKGGQEKRRAGKEKMNIKRGGEEKRQEP